MTLRNSTLFGMFALGLLLLTGCQTVEDYSLTYRLWDSSDFKRFCEPAPNPNLALFAPTNRSDLLVEYDAVTEGHSRVERRAYYLWKNEARVVAGKAPVWAEVSAYAGMTPVPVMPAPEAPAIHQPELPAYAVVIREGRSFTLHRSGEPDGQFDLPVYPETSGTPARVELSPLAVAGDALMVGGAATVIGFIVWLNGGAPGL